MFELRVKKISGEILTVELENGTETLVKEVKEKLVKLTGIETDRQRIIFTGRVLKDEDKLTSYGITEESTIQLVARPQDSPSSSSSHSNHEPSASAAPLFRNLGNGVLMGSITLDAPNLSQDNLQVQNIIGQMMNLAQSFTAPPPSRPNDPPREQSQPSSTEHSMNHNPSPTLNHNPSSRNSAFSNIPSESLASAHLQAMLQLLQNPAATPPPNGHLDIVLNDFFRVLNALQIPVVNLTRELPQNFDDSMTSSLSGGTLTQMIHLSHILRSLSAAANHLSLSLDRVTGMTPTVSQTIHSSSESADTLAEGSATGVNGDSLDLEEQSTVAVDPRSGDQDVILDGTSIDLDDEVD